MPTARLKAPVLVVVGLAFANAARAADVPAPVDDAAALLSRFREGDVPVESSVVAAIRTIGEHGGPADVPLLASLAARERTEIHDAAVVAIAEVQGRQRSSQREAFARALPRGPALRALTGDLTAAGVGSAEATCVAYTRWVVTRADDPSAADLGDPAGAVSRLARLAAEGDAEAHDELAAYGIDAERLLLGWMSGRLATDTAPNEARVLDVLVRRGGGLTVDVLVERTRASVASERATAIDALARMVDGAGRARPLPAAVREEAVGALRRVSLDTPDPVRGVALAALAQLAPDR